jgi:hypothetical protein
MNFKVSYRRSTGTGPPIVNWKIAESGTHLKRYMAFAGERGLQRIVVRRSLHERVKLT